MKGDWSVCADRDEAKLSLCDPTALFRLPARKWCSTYPRRTARQRLLQSWRLRPFWERCKKSRWHGVRCSFLGILNFKTFRILKKYWKLLGVLCNVPHVLLRSPKHACLRRSAHLARVPDLVDEQILHVELCLRRPSQPQPRVRALALFLGPRGWLWVAVSLHAVAQGLRQVGRARRNGHNGNPTGMHVGQFRSRTSGERANFRRPEHPN